MTHSEIYHHKPASQIVHPAVGSPIVGLGAEAPMTTQTGLTTFSLTTVILSGIAAFLAGGAAGWFLNPKKVEK